MVRACWLALTGCSAMTSPELAIDSIEPAMGPSTAPMPVTLAGAFHLPVTSDLDRGTTEVDAWSVWLADPALGDVALTDAVWRDEETIDGSVPAGLALGPHDVTVELGGGTAVLPGGYVVIDVTTPPAPPACPASYTLTLPSSTSSYRVIATADLFAPLHAACNADAPGATHLASLETVAEITDLQAALLGNPGQYYIGAVQQRDQALETDGWLTFSGIPLPSGQWGAGNPNDDIAGENNEENLAALNTGDLLHDVTGDLPYFAVCECDGIPIPSAVVALIP